MSADSTTARLDAITTGLDAIREASRQRGLDTVTELVARRPDAVELMAVVQRVILAESDC